MSTQASIDIKMVPRKNQFEPIELIEKLSDMGWSYCNNGKIRYLPVGDDDDFNWQTATMNETEILKILEQKKALGEIIGIELLWKGTQIGGNLLIWDDGNISFNLSVNRKIMHIGDMVVTDISWYQKNLLPCIIKNYLVESLTFEELA